MTWRRLGQLALVPIGLMIAVQILAQWRDGWPAMHGELAGPDAYMRLTGRGDRYEERPRTYWGLRRLWRQFRLYDYTVEMIRRPSEFHCAPELGSFAWFGRLPVQLLRLPLPLYPNLNWVLVKPEGDSR